jgi:hypothetical protein
MALGPMVYSASNRDEYQRQKKMFLGSGAGLACKADNLISIQFNLFINSIDPI